MGKILRVDLSTGKFTDLNLPEEPLLRKYWGGQLFAEYVLLNELPLNIDPYDSKNVIVGMTGPVTGTGLTPGGTKTCFVYLSPATRYTLGRAAPSGYFGAPPKTAGYDGIIITGAALKPTYLYIGEDKVELRDAGRVWAKACATRKRCCVRSRVIRTRASAPSAPLARTSFALPCLSTTITTRRLTVWAR